MSGHHPWPPPSRDFYMRLHFPHLTDVFDDIVKERQRQDAKWGWLENPKSILPNGSDLAKMNVVLEELGEASMALNDGDFDQLVVELTQTAACIVAWLESMGAHKQTEIRR